MTALEHEMPDGTYISVDDGKTWTKKPTPVYTHVVKGKTYISIDGKNWTVLEGKGEKIVKTVGEVGGKLVEWVLYGGKNDKPKKPTKTTKSKTKKKEKSFNEKMSSNPFEGGGPKFDNRWNRNPFQ
jgi:hypothetical protein